MRLPVGEMLGPLPRCLLLGWTLPLRPPATIHRVVDEQPEPFSEVICEIGDLVGVITVRVLVRPDTQSYGTTRNALRRCRQGVLHSQILTVRQNTGCIIKPRHDGPIAVPDPEPREGTLPFGFRQFTAEACLPERPRSEVLDSFLQGEVARG